MPTDYETIPNTEYNGSTPIRTGVPYYSDTWWNGIGCNAIELISLALNAVTVTRKSDRDVMGMRLNKIESFTVVDMPQGEVDCYRVSLEFRFVPSLSGNHAYVLRTPGGPLESEVVQEVGVVMTPHIDREDDQRGGLL